MSNETKSGDLVKILWHDGLGTSLYAKRLERGRFPWPSASGEAVSISAAQLGYLLEGSIGGTRCGLGARRKPADRRQMDSSDRIGMAAERTL